MIPLLSTRAAEDTARLAWAGPVVLAPTVEFLPLEPGADVYADRRVLAVTTPRSVAAASRFAPGRQVWALAPRTTAALEAVGVRVDRAVTGGVADLLAGADPSRVLLLTSDLGVAEAARRWPTLTALATHQTRRPVALPEGARALLASGGAYDVLVASPSAVENLDALAPGALGRARRVYCHGRSTLVAAQAFHPTPEPYVLGD